jgi:hypothetical protein
MAPKDKREGTNTIKDGSINIIKGKREFREKARRTASDAAPLPFVWSSVAQRECERAIKMHLVAAAGRSWVSPKFRQIIQSLCAVY